MRVLREFVHRWIWVVLLAFCIVGLIYPVIGLLAIICMMAPSVVAIWRGRMWCGRLCPRGSFNDIVLTKMSRNKAIPKLVKSKWFRNLFLVVLMSAFAIQLVLAWGNLAAIGGVFVRMIIITTLITVILGITYSHRAWCMMCPMGTMASWVTGIRDKTKKTSNNNKVTFIKDKCVSCNLCSKECPMGINVLSSKNAGAVDHPDCIKCNRCVYKCPKKSLEEVS